jgi:hypothetical protein
MEEKEPIPLRYETPPAPAPPDARRGCLIICVVLAAIAVALMLAFGEVGAGAVAAVVDLVLGAGIVVGVFAGIKYGTQKKDFWM